MQNDFEKVASDPRFSFLGNVDVGNDLTVDELKSFYHAIIFAYGAPVRAWFMCCRFAFASVVLPFDLVCICFSLVFPVNSVTV